MLPQSRSSRDSSLSEGALNCTLRYANIRLSFLYEHVARAHEIIGLYVYESALAHRKYDGTVGVAVYDVRYAGILQVSERAYSRSAIADDV